MHFKTASAVRRRTTCIAHRLRCQRAWPLLRAGLAACCVALLTLPVAGQAKEDRPATSLEIVGRTLDGEPFDLAALRGKVVVVVYWSTDCAVCRTVMPELRANYAGWQTQPFEIVFVNLDRSRADPERYDAWLKALLPTTHRFPSIWAESGVYRDNLANRSARLPLTLVLDKRGGIVATYEGRMPGEAWDDVADLLQ